MISQNVSSETFHSQEAARSQSRSHGGDLVAGVLKSQGVKRLYTLCGGHISPILTASDARSIQVIDCRHEASAAFAADAEARLTGIPGVVAVTAGPGITNTITALKNAEMAQSPLVLLGGAAATLLKGRGALQDIEQLALLKPLVKWSVSVKRVKDIIPSLEKAFFKAQEGVPGPVFVELPIDLLYPYDIVKTWSLDAIKGKSLAARGMRFYLSQHLKRVFAQAFTGKVSQVKTAQTQGLVAGQLAQFAYYLSQAKKPAMILGSQTMLAASQVSALQEAVQTLGIPVFLSGMARGLLGREEMSALHIRHNRSKALREADTVILAGVPCDFRLGYGQAISRKATLIGINRSQKDLKLNRKPKLPLLADPARALIQLAKHHPLPKENWQGWLESLQAGDRARDEAIGLQGEEVLEGVNPVYVCERLEHHLSPQSIIVGDGGDFVATASYILRPRKPLSWLDPGAFGTLGAGGGFALAAKASHPDQEVWLLYGDGSCGYSLAEFDTMTRHNLPVIAIIGNDGGWTQIAREQVEILGTALGTELKQNNYHEVAQGYGAVGLCVSQKEQLDSALIEAKRLAKEGKSVVINVMLGKSDFRKGSISM
ncbi:MAG: thiamine pyrophosphate-binding protein [Deinococcales bacterium]